MLLIGNLLTGLLVLLLHEAAHLAAAMALGIHVKRVGVSCKGMYIVRDAGAPVANMVTTLAGPFFNVLLAVAFPSLHEFALMNLIFGITNMIPFGGSDGQRALTLLSRDSRLRVPQL